MDSRPDIVGLTAYFEREQWINLVSTDSQEADIAHVSTNAVPSHPINRYPGLGFTSSYATLNSCRDAAGPLVNSQTFLVEKIAKWATDNQSIAIWWTQT
jgi:hypothetical protein